MLISIHNDAPRIVIMKPWLVPLHLWYNDIDMQTLGQCCSHHLNMTCYKINTDAESAKITKNLHNDEILKVRMPVTNKI